MIVERTDPDDPIGARGVAALAATGVLRDATEVVLRDQWIGDDGLARLLAAIDPSKLVRLEIPGSGIGSEGAARLARATQLARLRVLDVAFGHLPADAVRAIVSAPHWTALEQLNLSLDAVDVSVATALASSSCARSLRSLALNDCNGLDDAFVERLCGPGAFPKLESLSLGWNAITDRGARALAHAPLPSLAALFLEGTKIGADGIAELRARPFESLDVDALWTEESPPAYETDEPPEEPF